ncbi:STING domain-containing protein [Bariatricus sp. SGI.161]|uniref:STING domain-containing protein n=1 Tax=Bariatricus sp. SGI.161 TaxID=3420550 RepID=UPI003D046D1C
MKQQIFIGSSSETEHIAEMVKQKLQSEFECTTWKEHFFELNESIYKNLVKNSIGFSYAIFIGGADDEVWRLSQMVSKTGIRDNVYIEYGLYAGVLSPAHSFFIIDKRCSVATDLSGITLLYYADENDVAVCCEQIKNQIEQEEKISRIQLLPSTSLAIGYYENFLKQVCQAIYTLEVVEIEGIKYNVKDTFKRLHMVLPSDTLMDWKSWAEVYYRESRLENIEVMLPLRYVGLKINVEKLKRENELHIIDVPQTLRSSFKAVDLVLEKACVGETDFSIRAKKREVYNFIRTIENLKKEDAFVDLILQIDEGI